MDRRQVDAVRAVELSRTNDPGRVYRTELSTFFTQADQDDLSHKKPLLLGVAFLVYDWSIGSRISQSEGLVDLLHLTGDGF